VGSFAGPSATVSPGFRLVTFVVALTCRPLALGSRSPSKSGGTGVLTVRPIIRNISSSLNLSLPVSFDTSSQRQNGREGGIVRVDIHSRDSKLSLSGRIFGDIAWPKGSTVEFWDHVNLPLVPEPLEATITFTDERQVNMHWICELEFDLTTSKDRVIKLGCPIDVVTTGPGQPRSASRTVPEHP
jgi:hypothetical protein